MQNLEKFIIRIDSREQIQNDIKNWFLYYKMNLKLNFNFIIKIEALDVGDIIVERENGEILVCIERKNVNSDLVSSIRSGRLYEQLEGMLAYKNRYLAMVGSPYKFNSKATTKSIGTVQVSIQERYFTKVVWVKDIEFYVYETIKIIEKILKVEKKIENGEITIPHIIRPISYSTKLNKDMDEETIKIIKMNDELVRVVMGLTNVNETRAKNLLSYFGSLENLFKADYDELIEVEQIGDVLAKKISETSYRFYNSKV